jgi:hypothetical protein
MLTSYSHPSNPRVDDSATPAFYPNDLTPNDIVTVSQSRASGVDDSINSDSSDSRVDDSTTFAGDSDDYIVDNYIIFFEYRTSVDCSARDTDPSDSRVDDPTNSTFASNNHVADVASMPIGNDRGCFVGEEDG